VIQVLSPPENEDFVRVCSKPGASYIVSLIGAGGKTSTVYWLAHELLRRGLKVIVTTTTHMYLPDPGCVGSCIIDPDLKARIQASKQEMGGIVACFSAFDEQTGKVTGCLPEEVGEIKKKAVADVVLVEADGARHCLLKVPGGHEPCIPDCSDIVIAVSGGDALLQPADPDCIHRWPLFSALAGIKVGDVVDKSVLEKLLNHPQGIFKNVPEHAHRHWLINGGHHDQELIDMLHLLAGANSELDGVWLGDMRRQQPFKMAWLRERIDEQES
jgi:probable selenium-dependent hydroxylase accessory protein YqeC